MKILVPSDFSKVSHNAALYAAKFARTLDAELIVVHVVHVESPPMVQVLGFIEQEIEEIRSADASQEGASWLEELQSKVEGLQVSFTVLKGHPMENVIEHYALANQIDLIVMGTKGGSGLQKVLFGTNAVAVIDKSSIPVITLPAYSRFHQVQRIVYASDLHAIRSEMHPVISLAKRFDASVDILHVQMPHIEENIHKQSLEQELIQYYGYPKISLNLVEARDVVEGIDEFVADVSADILAFHTHERGFFEKFLRTSISREEAFHSPIPLLTFKGS